MILPSIASPGLSMRLWGRIRGFQSRRFLAAIPHAIPAQMVPHRIAVGQMTSIDDLEANRKTCEGLAAQAAAAGASVLFLPECFSFLGKFFHESLSIAEHIDGPVIQGYVAMARRHNIWLSLGGFQERTADADRLHNTHLVIDATGTIQKTYRKIHLFDVDVPGGPVLMESRFTAPGDRLAAVNLPAGRLGMSICYDLRFPAFYQRLRFDMGADIIAIPSAFTVETGKAHWEVLLRARAIETQCYVVAAAQAGRHNAARESYGHAMIIDPWGRIIAQLDGQETGIAVADVDVEGLKSVRQRMPLEAHRAAGAAAVEKKDDGEGM